MTRLDHEPDLDLAIAATRLAGEAVMRHFRKGEPVAYKSAEQPVTAADLAADRILGERLLAGTPGYGWLSEESVDDPRRLECERLWIVDPIDGTNSFVAGLPEFAVSVGLVERGEPVLGVILNPATGELYHALRGGGAYRDGVRLRSSPGPAEDARPVLLASRAEIAEGAFAEAALHWEVRALGSTAYRMVKVADGSAHATFSGRTKNDWDLCAAALIAAEAGARVGDASGAPLRFNLPAPTHAGIGVAAGALLARPGSDIFFGLSNSRAPINPLRDWEVPDGRA